MSKYIFLIKKIIYFYLVVFIAFFSVLGNISYADNEANKVNVNLNIEVNGEKTTYNQLGLKLVQKGSSREIDLNDNTKLLKGENYKLKYNENILTLNSFNVENKLENKNEFKVSNDTSVVNISLDFSLKNAKKVFFNVNVKDTEFYLNQLDIEFVGSSGNNKKDIKKFSQGDTYSYLKEGYEYEIKYDNLNYKLNSIEIGGEEIKDNKFKVDENSENGVLNFDYNNEDISLKVNLTAPKDIEKHIKINTNIKDFYLNKENIIPRGKYEIEFSNILKGYDIVPKISNDIEITRENKKDSIKYILDVNKNSEISFGVTNEIVNVLVDTPKEKEKTFYVYSTPNTTIKGNIVDLNKEETGNINSPTVIEEFSATTNSNGKAEVNIKERVFENDIITVFGEKNNLYATNSVLVTRDTENIELGINSPKSKDSTITGVSKGENVELYIYNEKTEEFRAGVNETVNNNSFEIKLNNPLKNYDKLYIKGINKTNSGVYTEFNVENVDFDPTVERIFGKNRYETSVNIAKKSFKEPSNIIIANGYKSADVLAAGPLANELNAPILLVDTNNVSKEVINYITSSKAENIFFIGGSNSISNSLIKKIVDESKLKSIRVYGEDRYETSCKIAKTLIEDFNYKNEIIIANGIVDADALAASPYATTNKKPIVLSEKNKLPKTVQITLKDLKVNKAEIIGGKNTISENILKETNIDLQERIFGNDRYETSLEIAKKLDNDFYSVIIANGYKSADALTASTLAYNKKAAILLTDENSVKDYHSDFIINKVNNGELEQIYIVGGNMSISNKVLKDLNKLISK